MPEANVAIVVKPTAPGLWTILADFFLNSIADGNRMRTGGASRLFGYDWLGVAYIISDWKTVDANGQVKYEGIEGSDSDGSKRHLRIMASYTSPSGAIFYAPKDFYLGLNNWTDGLQGDTATYLSIATKSKKIYSELHPVTKEYLTKKTLMRISV